MLRTLGIALAPRTATCTRPWRLLVPPAGPRQIVGDVADRGQQGRVDHRTAQPKQHDREAPCPQSHAWVAGEHFSQFIVTARPQLHGVESSGAAASSPQLARIDPDRC
jgi:hypothetical protein